MTTASTTLASVNDRLAQGGATGTTFWCHVVPPFRIFRPTAVGAGLSLVNGSQRAVWFARKSTVWRLVLTSERRASMLTPFIVFVAQCFRQRATPQSHGSIGPFR